MALEWTNNVEKREEKMLMKGGVTVGIEDEVICNIASRVGSSSSSL